MVELIKNISLNSETVNSSDEDAEDRQYRLVSVWVLPIWTHTQKVCEEYLEGM